VKQNRGYKRGYPVALLVGLEEDHAVLWQLFSQAAKLCLTLSIDGKRTDRRALYNFHEHVIHALQPLLKEGIRSIAVTSPAKTTFAADFMDHVRKHHAYLIQSERSQGAAFVELVGSADQPQKVAKLAKTRVFRGQIAETTSQEADRIVSALDKHLSSGDSVVLFSLREIEDMVYDSKKLDHLRPEYLMLTEKYLANNKNRLLRLLQVSKNKHIKTRIVSTETSAGKRISQFGGIVFFTTPTG
jgi:stalled ribosome rescue protein Dom34